MSRKRKSSKGGVRSAGAWMSNGLARLLRPRVAYVLVGFMTLGAGAYAVARGVEHLRLQLNRQLTETYPFAAVDFVDLPPQLAVLAQAELEDSLISLLDGPWTDDRLCRRMAERLQQVGWVAAVRQVRRHNNGRFTIECHYRIPAAMVAHGDNCYLVDDEGVRLPGEYRADASWQVIDGVAASPPEPGETWEGADLQAGLRVLQKLRGEPFAHQVAGIDVHNFKGRSNPRRWHLVLRTHQQDGSIRWGSAPGSEVEENTVAQKLAILRANFHQTGRADAGHPVIDVSTFPDRYTIPG